MLSSFLFICAHYFYCLFFPLSLCLPSAMYRFLPKLILCLVLILSVCCQIVTFIFLFLFSLLLIWILPHSTLSCLFLFVHEIFLNLHCRLYPFASPWPVVCAISLFLYLYSVALPLPPLSASCSFYLFPSTLNLYCLFKSPAFLFISSSGFSLCSELFASIFSPHIVTLRVMFFLLLNQRCLLVRSLFLSLCSFLLLPLWPFLIPASFRALSSSSSWTKAALSYPLFRVLFSLWSCFIFLLLSYSSSLVSIYWRP